MSSSRSKAENRKALKTFIPLMIGAALIGGVIGGLSVTSGVEGFMRTLGERTEEVMFWSLPWIVIAIELTAGGVALCLYKKARRMANKILPNPDFEEITADSDVSPSSVAPAISNNLMMQDEPSEEDIKGVDKIVTIGFLILSVGFILSMVSFAAAVGYFRRYVDENIVPFALSILFFIIGDFMVVKMQQLFVDLEKELFPEKRGSVYDIKFKEKFWDSCDEMERMIICRSAYKAYNAAVTACTIAIVILIIAGIIFDIGPVPVLVAGAIWLTLIISYAAEAIKLEKEKVDD